MIALISSQVLPAAPLLRTANTVEKLQERKWRFFPRFLRLFSAIASRDMKFKA